MLFNTCKGRKEIDCKRIINRAHRIAPGKFGGSTRVYFKSEFAVLYLFSGIIESSTVRPSFLTNSELRSQEERVRDDFNWDKYHPDDLLLYPDYWLIGIRTSLDGTYVAGFDDAGKVEYKYPWCVADDTPGKGYSCHGLGPWTCSGGMTFTECCDYAKADVASRGLLVADLHGNYLECYDSPPPEADPLDYGRVKLHVDRGNVVVHTPRNG